MTASMSADRPLGLGARGSVAGLLVVIVIVTLGAWAIVSSESGGFEVRQASPAASERIIAGLYGDRRPAVAVFVLADDRHRAAVCSGPGREVFLQEEHGRWREEHMDIPSPWARALLAACPYVP
jgi:hypothetical protein